MQSERVNLSSDADDLHVCASRDLGDLFLEVFIACGLNHEACLEFGIEAEGRTVITHGSFPLFICGETLGFCCEGSKREHLFHGEALVLELVKIDNELVKVDADSFTISGGHHKLLAEICEDTGCISLS